MKEIDDDVTHLGQIIVWAKFLVNLSNGLLASDTDEYLWREFYYHCYLRPTSKRGKMMVDNIRSKEGMVNCLLKYLF